MAYLAKAAANYDPIMVLVVCLFAAAAMADDGVLRTNRAMAHESGAGLRPIGVKVVLGGGKWDK
jgi:hypothetical protein